MNVYGVNTLPQSNSPTIPSNSNPSLLSKEVLLAKTVLGSNKSSPSSLATKKVEREVPEEALDEKTNEFRSPYLTFKKTNKNREIIKTQIAEYVRKLNEKPTELKVEMNIRFRLVNNILRRLVYCGESTRTICLEDACIQVKKMQQAAYFNNCTQMATYLLKVHEGINCLDLVAIRDAILTLNRRNTLAGDESKELKDVKEFFETRWTELKEGGQLDEETYNILNQSLKQILAEDPFKDEFIKNSELFKQVKDAPESLLQKYPHLASVMSFLSKYPEAGTINLPDNTYNSTNLNICINQARTSPLARLLILVSPESLLTPVHARMLKDLLVEKQSLEIAFGNEDDLSTLTDAFIKDSSLVLGEKSLVRRPKYLDNYGEVLFFSINPEYPVKKKSAVILQGNTVNCPRSPSLANMTLSAKGNQNTSLSQVILEDSTKSTPSSLQTKKATTSISEPILEQGEIGYTPLKFRVTSKQTQSIQLAIDNTSKTVNEIIQESRLNKDPKHRLNEELCLRALYITSLLLKSKLAHIQGASKIEKDCIELAQKHLSVRLKDSYFHGDIQFASYMNKAYPEIKKADLVNMNVLRDLLFTLRRAAILSPDSESPASKELALINEFLPKHWKALVDGGKLTENDNQLLNDNLKHLMSEDPFRDEFIKYPDLFKQVKDAPEALLKAYPHLESASTFISKYPRAGWIELPNQTFNTENLKQFINQAKTNPLAKTIILDSVEPIITPSLACQLKDILVEKQDLTLALGNKKDITTIILAFYDDIHLVFDKMTTFLSDVGGLGDGRKLIPFRINPQSRIKKVPPPIFRSADRTDWTIRIRSSSGEALSSIGYVIANGREQPIDVVTRYDGKRILAVMKCDYEYALNLNRRYVDENGQIQEYEVAVLAEK